MAASSVGGHTSSAVALTEDALSVVFKHLPSTPSGVKDLASCTLVSKQFQGVIEASPSLMAKLEEAKARAARARAEAALLAFHRRGRHGGSRPLRDTLDASYFSSIGYRRALASTGLTQSGFGARGQAAALAYTGLTPSQFGRMGAEAARAKALHETGDPLYYSRM